jgi:hypothetical protein
MHPSDKVILWILGMIPLFFGIVFVFIFVSNNIVRWRVQDQ